MITMMATAATPTNNPKETSIVQFEFNKKVYTDVKIIDSKDIKMIWDKTEINTLNGFEITVQKSTGKKLAKVQEQTAPRLTNILSSITGTEISYKEPPVITIIRNGSRSQTVTATLSLRNLKPTSLERIELSNISSLLTKYSKLYMQLGHAHNGNRAFFNKDYPQAIREFFLIFEYTGCIEEIKYRNLRNAVSHVRLDKPKAISDLKNNFRIKMKSGEELDVNKPRIKATLYKHTRKFRDSVGLYLQEQLRIELGKKEEEKRKNKRNDK
jgi:hypothetical protein